MTTRITQTDRLDRIEDKIDKMSEAIVTLARVEEKISDLEIRREEQHVRLNRLSEKIDNIDSHVTSLVENVSFMKKLVWFFFATIATLTLSIIVS
jgi:chromosome segregation ATPase